MRSLDTETTGVDFKHGAQPYLVTSAYFNGDQPINEYWEWDVDPVTRKVDVPVGDIREIQDTVDEADQLVLQNTGFDVEALQVAAKSRFRWPWGKVRDTLFAAHLLGSNLRKDLATLALTLCGINIKPLEDALEKACNEARRIARSKYPDWRIAKKGLREMPSAKDKVWKYDSWLPRTIARLLDYEEDHPWWTVASEYANGDSTVTLLVWQAQWQEIQRRGLEAIYLKRLESLPVAYKIEQRGVTVNQGRLEELRTDYRKVAAKCSRVCANLSGGELEELPKGVSGALRRVVFDKFNLVSSRFTPAGWPSMDKYAIDDWLLDLDPSDRRHCFLRNLKNFRQRTTAVTYMDSYERFWVPLPGAPGWWVLHPSLNPTATATLRWSSSNPNEQNICVDGETEFLTRDGWVPASKLVEGQQVAQYWEDTKEVDFTSAQVYSQRFRGSMQHITTGQQIDLLLTPAHRCLVRDRKTGRTRTVRADAFPKWAHHLHAGVYKGGVIDLLREEVIWLCAVQADGSYVKCEGKQYGVRITLKKQRKINRLRKCLNALGVDYKESKRQDSSKFYVGVNDDLVVKTKELMPDKCFGPWLLSCSRETINAFLEEVFLWDGGSNRKRMYSSSDKKNADWVQILFTLSGSRAWIRSYKPDSAWAKRIHHCVNITKGRDYSGTGNHSREQIPWNGRVYCVTVPSSFVIVRRNGKVSITGNSKQEGFNLRYCFGPAPGREWWSLDAENIELRIPAYEAGETEMIYLFENQQQGPYYGSYHLLIFDTLHPEKFARHGKNSKKEYASTWYQWTKNGNFAVQYGAVEASGTADRAYHVPGAQHRIQERFGKVAQLNQKMIDIANKRGFIETMPDYTVDANKGYPLLCTRSKWGDIKPTVPLNYHVQGTAMWWMMKAMIRCQEYLDTLDDHYMVMQVHDELVFDFPKGSSHEDNLSHIREIQQLMEQGGEDIGVPTPVGIEYHEGPWSEGVRV